jgi:hypothetical protein
MATAVRPLPEDAGLVEGHNTTTPGSKYIIIETAVNITALYIGKDVKDASTCSSCEVLPIN